MKKQIPTNCMDTSCPHNHICGMPDFFDDDYICTVHYECALGYENFEKCQKEGAKQLKK